MSLTTDANGELVAQARYEPYGKLRWNGGTVMPTDYAFTGQRQDGFGLMDYNARFCNRKTGHDLQATRPWVSEIVVRQDDEIRSRSRSRGGSPLRGCRPY